MYYIYAFPHKMQSNWKYCSEAMARKNENFVRSKILVAYFYSERRQWLLALFM